MLFKRNEFMNRIIHGDCLEELRRLPDNSVDLVCTDPPYGDNAGYGRAGRTIANNENPLVGLLALSASFRLLKNHRACFSFF
jgi:DNA modification methylase